MAKMPLHDIYIYIFKNVDLSDIQMFVTWVGVEEEWWIYADIGMAIMASLTKLDIYLFIFGPHVIDVHVLSVLTGLLRYMAHVVL
ncbi:unnamed protein product [Camellia sinensis]